MTLSSCASPQRDCNGDTRAGRVKMPRTDVTNGDFKYSPPIEVTIPDELGVAGTGLSLSLVAAGRAAAGRCSKIIRDEERRRSG